MEITNMLGPQSAICNSTTRKAFDALVLEREWCSYWKCAGCGFLSVEQPWWLDEAYASFDRRADMGAVQRALGMSVILSSVLTSVFGTRGRFLDFAGGTGLLTRLMRDNGFDFYWTDLYDRNLFASGFEARSGDGFDAITAIEVLEHVPNPIDFFPAPSDNRGARCS